MPLEGRIPLALSKVYQVRHKVYGSFVARAVEPNIGWCGFVILEDNEKLRADQFDNGSYIELTADFFRATPL